MGPVKVKDIMKNGRIYNKNPMVTATRHSRTGSPSMSCCIKIDYKGYEISISADNSCGAFGDELRRTELRIFKGLTMGDDVTMSLIGNVIYSPTLDDLVRIKGIIDSKVK